MWIPEHPSIGVRILCRANLGLDLEGYRIGARLDVIAMRNYARTAWYDETGLTWRAPSPNLRTLTQAILYPGVAMVEGTAVSVGRGTPTPFEVLGAPWIDANELAATLDQRDIAGVRFVPARFTPATAPYRGIECRGVRIVLTDRDRFDAGLLDIELARALYARYPAHFNIDATLGLVGSRATLQAIRSGETARQVTAQQHAVTTMMRGTRITGVGSRETTPTQGPCLEA